MTLLVSDGENGARRISTNSGQRQDILKSDGKIPLKFLNYLLGRSMERFISDKVLDGTLEPVDLRPGRTAAARPIRISFVSMSRLDQTLSLSHF